MGQPQRLHQLDHVSGTVGVAATDLLEQLVGGGVVGDRATRTIGSQYSECSSSPWLSERATSMIGSFSVLAASHSAGVVGGGPGAS